MKNLFRCCYGILLTANLVSCSTENAPELKGSRPNIVFILADDLGWADLPVYGNPFNEAPNLTAMAGRGIRFTNAYAACPVCSPTRASIMSGQYPARVGIIDFIPGHWRLYEEVTVPKNRTQYLPLEIYTMGELMKDAGYATGYFGKWHLGWNEHYPENQGFDQSRVYKGGGFFDVGNKMDPPVDADPERVLSEVLTDLSLDFIEAHHEDPFFLFLAHFDVHIPLDADSALIMKYMEKEKTPGYPCNAIYAAMIEHVDKSLGRILGKLDELGITDETLVVFFSDNGGLVSRFDLQSVLAASKQYLYQADTLSYISSSNHPLRAEKGTVYEGGIREPMILQWPGKLEGGRVSQAIVSSVDFLPTFAELAGVELPDYQVFDGVSLVDVLRRDRYDPERAIFWHYPVYHHMQPASAVRKGDWKLVENLVTGELELFNLREDIGEENNLAGEDPDKTAEMKKLLDSWRKDAGAEFPVANPDFDPERRMTWGTHPDVAEIIRHRDSR